MIPDFFLEVLAEAWGLLLESSVYVLFGLLVAGLLRVYLSPARVAGQLGRGTVKPVLKAALLGIPLPLCSCGVLPAAVSLRKQGANKGAVSSFLISTPESGVDSIAISYALLDPILTVVRPLAGFVTATAAGIFENLLDDRTSGEVVAPPDLTCPIDACCTGENCPPAEHRRHHTFWEKMRAGLRFAREDVWGDMAGWFFVGLLLAGVVMALFPEDFIATYMGGGISAILIMLVAGMPIYICATASTPIAAAFILKGVSPGAALVFLLAGPATNVTSLAVLRHTLGGRATAVYLCSIMVFSVLFGLGVDALYNGLGLSARALVGEASEIVPAWARFVGVVVLAAMSIKPVGRTIRGWFTGEHAHGEDCGCERDPHGLGEPGRRSASCGCSSEA
ncbi:MAG: SO_0444 family Cu/Zn efflux transporter [Desulfatibacillaceae bacterium]